MLSGAGGLWVKGFLLCRQDYPSIPGGACWVHAPCVSLPPKLGGSALTPGISLPSWTSWALDLCHLWSKKEQKDVNMPRNATV